METYSIRRCVTCYCLADRLSLAHADLPRKVIANNSWGVGTPVRLVAHESLSSYGLLTPVRASTLSPLTVARLAGLHATKHMEPLEESHGVQQSLWHCQGGGNVMSRHLKLHIQEKVWLPSNMVFKMFENQTNGSFWWFGYLLGIRKMHMYISFDRTQPEIIALPLKAQEKIICRYWQDVLDMESVTPADIQQGFQGCVLQTGVKTK